MSLRGRVRRVEEGAGLGVDVVVPVIWDGTNEDRCREHAERARRHGWKIRLILIGVQDTAGSVEEADAIVVRHRESQGAVPITVYREGSRMGEVLAEWEPRLPEWLGGVP